MPNQQQDHLGRSPNEFNTFNSLLESFEQNRLNHTQLYILLYALFLATDALHLFDGFLRFVPSLANVELRWLHEDIRKARYDVDRWTWICRRAGLQPAGEDEPPGKPMSTWRDGYPKDREKRRLLERLLGPSSAGTNGTGVADAFGGATHYYEFVVPGQDVLAPLDEQSPPVLSLDSAAQVPGFKLKTEETFTTSAEDMQAILAALAERGDRVMLENALLERHESQRAPSFSPFPDRGAIETAPITTFARSGRSRGSSEASSVLSSVPGSIGASVALHTPVTSDFPLESSSSPRLAMASFQNGGKAEAKCNSASESLTLTPVPKPVQTFETKTHDAPARSSLPQLAVSNAANVSKQRTTRRTASLLLTTPASTEPRPPPKSKVAKTPATKTTADEAASPDPGSMYSSMYQRSAYQSSQLRKRDPADTVAHVGPIFYTKRAVFARESKPYVHAICGRRYKHPDDVKGHHSGYGRRLGCKDGKRKWDEHESCKASVSNVRIKTVREGYVVGDQESWDFLQRCIKAGEEAGIEGEGDEMDVDGDEVKADEGTGVEFGGDEMDTDGVEAD